MSFHGSLHRHYANARDADQGLKAVHPSIPVSSLLPIGPAALNSAPGDVQSTAGRNMRTLSFLLLLIAGLALALPGAWLAMLGGSLYYVIAGVLILICAFLVRRGRAAGI